MRFSRPVLEAASAALAEIQPLTFPADSTLSRFFREHPKIGQQDRATIAETCYAALRRGRLLAVLTGDVAPRKLVLAVWVAFRGANLRELESFLKQAELDWLGGIKAAARLPQPFEVECDLPDWLLDRLRAQMSDEAVLALAKGLQEPAPLDLRVNLLKISREAALERLTTDGIEAKLMPYSPAGLRLAGKPAINRHPLFLDGSIEVQDEGSQLVCQLVAPRRGEMVADFCAGAGGKTLALGALMHSSGRLYAFDVSASRLEKLSPRLKRSGLSNVHPQRIEGERDTRVKRLARKLDRVLADVPCSGLGTLRRNPDLKWRQKPEDVAEMQVKQRAILAGSAALVKPGGRLVYATCSILQEENAGVVEGFLEANPDFALVPADSVLSAARIPLDTGPYLSLAPHTHHTDGFFAAVLERSR
jgi:16S rRNA (cytosine967-C5)-methyltransferase